MLHGSLFGSIIRAGIYRQAYGVSGSAAGRQIPRNAGAFSGLMKGLKIETRLQLSILGNLGMKPSLVTVAENVPLPCGLSFRSYVHSGEQTEVEAGKNSKYFGDECVVMKGGKSKADSKRSDSWFGLSELKMLLIARI
ncbi:hypothetical protein C2S53_017015 [Perilla frutescens var. hirtella]|uniref:Uncharacterized protein n=1 Tax=Perilla frutescens var. hirtella TaxID=608512 RepID=A0AAD4JHZ8_PERFH|nr:hypothetical protein C2S53_017015 [Perilla frutescens var. hirtella]